MTHEPMLTLRASDPAAPEAVRSYAIRRHKIGDTSESIARLLDLARSMERWRADQEHAAVVAEREALRPPPRSIELPCERPLVVAPAAAGKAKRSPPAADHPGGVF